MNDSRFRSPVAVILLSIITCGFYFLYWIYKMSDDIQGVSSEEENVTPGIELLLCIVTCGLYTFYWYYKYGKKIYAIHLEKDITPADDNALLYIILAVFQLQVIGMAIMQSSVNKIWTQDGYAK